MSTISKNLLGFMFGGNSALNLASAAFKGSVNTIIGFNAGGTGYTSFKPTSNFNSLTQLTPDGVYIVDAKTLGFDIPDALLVAGAGGSVATPDLGQLLRAQLPPTFDFYVSSTAGDDANDGFTPASAKRSLAAVLPLAAGTSLGLERGSHWREVLKIVAPNVRVGAYGVGERPVLDASDVVLASIISKTAGQTLVYQFGVTPMPDAIGRLFPFSTFEDGQRLKRVASVAACEAAAGSFYPTASLVYFHPITGSDPRADGKVYEVAVRDAGIDALDTASGLRLDGLHAKRSLINDGVLRVNGKGSVVTDCVAEDGTKHTLYVTDGCLLEDVVAWKGEGMDSYFVYYYSNSNADSVGTTFRRCVAIGGFAHGEEQSAYATGSGYYCHSLAGTHLASVTYENCLVENLGAGFSGDALVVNVTGCATHLVPAAVYCASYVGQVVNVRGNFFDQRDGAAYQKTNGQQRAMLTAEIGTTNIERNVLLMAPAGYAFFLFSHLDGAVINFNHNTLMVESNASCGVFSKSGAGLLSFAGNIFYGIAEPVALYGNATQVASSGNVYYRPSGGIKFGLPGSQYNNLGDWQAAQQDAGALVVDPDFSVVRPARWRTVGNAVPSEPQVRALGAGAV